MSEKRLKCCNDCKYHYWDYTPDDGYCGEEFEVCDKGHDIPLDGKPCEDWVYGW